MTQGPFPAHGPDGEEPDGCASRPGGENGPQDDFPPEEGPKEGPEEGPEEGLFLCVPAGNADLSGFIVDAGAALLPPGPLLAGLTYAVAGSDGAGLAGTSEDFLFAVMSAGRRMSSWGTWLELSAMRELALRHPAPPARRKQPSPGSPSLGSPSPGPAGAAPADAAPADAAPADAVPAGAGPPAADLKASAAPAPPPADGRVQLSEFAADEVAAGLRLTWMAAAARISYACDLAGRLPVTFAALGAGLIDPVHAKIIYEQTDILSAADAAKADPVLAAAAQTKTYGELRYTAARLVLKLHPGSAERRQQARRQEAHVRPFREDSGNAGMTAREMPSDEVLASWQHIDQRARDLRAAGVPGTMRELRVRAYLDLLQERDSRDAVQDPAGHPGAGPAGPVLAARVNITVPLTTLTGESGTPGEAAGFGLLDAQSARDLIAAAARSPHTRWCVTALYPDGTAAAHGCAPGQHPAPPGPAPPGSEPSGPAPPGPGSPPGGPDLGTADPGAACDTRGRPDQRPPPGTRAQDYLRSLRVQLTPIARGTCGHRHAENGYKPSRKLQHLIHARSTRCSAPGCGRQAARCDLDHTVAWHLGGSTCECNLAPLCRHHHRCKQEEGWWLEQLEPGVLKWRTPTGRTYTTTPTEYPI